MRTFSIFYIFITVGFTVIDGSVACSVCVMVTVVWLVSIELLLQTISEIVSYAQAENWESRQADRQAVCRSSFRVKIKPIIWRNRREPSKRQNWLARLSRTSRFVSLHLKFFLRARRWRNNCKTLSRGKKIVTFANVLSYYARRYVETWETKSSLQVNQKKINSCICLFVWCVCVSWFFFSYAAEKFN